MIKNFLTYFFVFTTVVSCYADIPVVSSIYADSLVKEIFIDSKDAKIFCRTMGKGKPLIILHGGPGLTQDYLLPQMVKLAESNFIIFYDQRGCGKSTGEINADTINMETFVSDIEAIRQAFHFDKISVLGHSWGGFLAMHYAISHPEHVDKIILANSMSASSEGLALFVNECRDHLPQTLIEQCRQYYDRHVNLLTSVDGPCVIHRDFRPGNLIVYQGKLQGIIDWAGGRSSFAEEDFCSMEHGEWPNNSKKPFLVGYASIRSVPDYHELMPFLRLGKAIATIGFTVKQGTWASKHARIYQFNRPFLANFFPKINCNSTKK